MDNALYKYKGKSWRSCPTKADTNSFFHAAFGTRDREGEEFLDKDAQFRRMRWATFLTYFASKSMPPRLEEVLRRCFSTDDKHKHASVGDEENFMKYISGILASERNVTIEEISILATLENVQIVVLSSTRPDPVVIVTPNPDILGNYPNAEKAKEEVVLCREGDIFSKLELVKEMFTPKPDKNIVGNKIIMQSENNFDKYRKGGSAGSKGVRYQVNLLVMVLLNALKNLSGWKLSTENEDGGKFDDIVVEETEGATFIQSKHKENKRKRITLEDLTSTNSKNDDFSLPKYFLSYLQIKKKFKIKSVILCTNADVHESVLKLLDQHDACTEDILHFEGDYSFHTLKDEMLASLKENIKSYYEQNFKKKGIKESEITDENLKDFQQHLQLYFNYPSLNRMGTIIDKSMSLIRCCNSSRGKIFSSEMYLKMKEWYQQKEGTYLTEAQGRAMISEIWREKYYQELEEYEVSFCTDDLNFQQQTQIFHVITNDGYLLQVMRIYRAIRSDKTKTLFVNLHDDTDIQKQVIEAFSLKKYTFLVIIWPQYIRKFGTNYEFGELKVMLEKFTYKKIIVVAEDNDGFFQQIGWNKEVVRISRPVAFEDLHSLSQERLLKKKNIVFQGEKVSLEEILGVGDVEYYSRALNTETLEKLIRGEEIKVGARLSELDEYIDRYYISRSFKRKLNKTPDEKWNNGEKKEKVLHGELYGELGKMDNDEMNQEEILSEANIYDVKEKVVIISDSAGTGKSTVLAKLALLIKENNPHLWIIRIELNDFTKFLRESLRNGKETVNIIELLNSENATKLTNHLEEFLFSTSKKVVLLLDGVDEISPDYTELILGLLKQCREKSNVTKIFVTTRPHMIKKLEQVSKVKLFILQKFTEQNQLKFFMDYWENGLHLKDDISKEKCKRYAKALLRKWMNFDTSEGNRVTTVPLQLRMMAEIFQENAKSNESGGWIGCREYIMGSEFQPCILERINITDLYRLLLKKKQLIFIEKGNPTGNTIASDLISKTFDDCLVYHRSLALEMILGKDKLHLFSCYQLLDKTSETQMLKIGIVQKTKEEMHFIHRTFADYFVAECLFSELQQNPTLEFQKFLIDTIFVHPQYNVTRTFFDSLLQKVQKSLSPNVFKEYRSLKQENSMEFYKLQSQLLHLLAEGNCIAILPLILKCIDFKTVRGKEIDILNFYRTHFNIHKNIFGNTLNLLQYLTRKAGVNIKDEWSWTPLHYAAEKGHLEMVKFLVEAGADINSQNNSGITALHFAASGNHLNTTEFLLGCGADSSIRKNNGFTALQTATYFGQLETVKFLTENGSDINVISDDGSTLLHSASRNGHLDTIKYLLELGIDPQIRKHNGFTALHRATYLGQLETVKFLTEHGSKIDVVSNDGSTLLHSASRNGHLGTIKYLSELGIDPHIRDINGVTALQMASYYGHLETVKFLTDHGSDINVVNNLGHTVLHLASENGHFDTVKYFFEHGIDPHIRNNDGFTALQTATYSGHLETVKFLTEHGSDVNVVSNDGSTLLHSASENGHLDTLKYLSELGIDPHIRDNYGFTALHLATCFGQLETVKFLAENGSDINVVSNDGSTLLHSASENGRLDTVKYIFELGIDHHIRDNCGFTALHLATHFGYLETVQFLTEHGSDINVANNFGETLLHSASGNGHLDIVKYLLDIGVNVNTRDCHGFTVLHSAAQYGDLKTIKFLVKYGLDINISSNNGHTLLHLAGANGRLEAIKYFLDLGIDPNIRDNHGFTAFHLVGGNDQLEIVKSFIEYGLDVNTMSTDGFTLLHLTSADGRLEMVKFLLESDADFGVRDNDGYTPLHLAAKWCQLDAVKLLVTHGLDYNVTTSDGRTPLHLSSEEGHSDIVKYFLEVGADCNVRDYTGRTALHLAVLADQLDVVKLLVEHGGDLKVEDNGGHTALHFAVDIGHSDTIDFLMKMETYSNIVE